MLPIRQNQLADSTPLDLLFLSSAPPPEVPFAQHLQQASTPPAEPSSSGSDTNSERPATEPRGGQAEIGASDDSPDRERTDTTVEGASAEPTDSQESPAADQEDDETGREATADTGPVVSQQGTAAVDEELLAPAEDVRDQQAIEWIAPAQQTRTRAEEGNAQGATEEALPAGDQQPDQQPDQQTAAGGSTPEIPKANADAQGKLGASLPEEPSDEASQSQDASVPQVDEGKASSRKTRHSSEPGTNEVAGPREVPVDGDESTPTAAADPPQGRLRRQAEQADAARQLETAERPSPSATTDAKASDHTVAPPNNRWQQTPLLAKSGTAPAQTERLPPADHARFMQRVSRAVETALQRGGPLRLRLSPPELGAMKVEVRLHGNTLTAHIEAETQVARTALLHNLGDLRERLAEQGIQIESFDVDVMPQSGQDHSQQQPDHSSAPRTSATPGPERPSEIETSEAVVKKSRLDDKSINVII